MADISCIVCGGKISTRLFYATDQTVSHKSFGILKCSECGFLSTEEPPLPQEASSYYESENYEPHKKSGNDIVTLLYRRARSLMLRYKLKVTAKAISKRSGKLLDYGAGTGEFVGLAKSSGWNASGVEISEAAREQAKNRDGIILTDPKELDTLEKGSFDSITYWHVLEHIYDPGNHIKSISSLLSPDGCLVIALPNAGSFDSRHYQSHWAALDVPRHLWHFSPTHFERFINLCGFEVTDTKRLFFDPFYISILSEKYKGSRYPLISGLIYGLKFAIRSIFKIEGSSSLIYICKKKK